MSLVKQMTHFSHKGGENPWILAVKGREESTPKPVQMSKEGKSSLEWGTGEGGDVSMGPWTPWAQRTPFFLILVQRQKTAGKQNGLVSVTQEGTLPCTPFNGELPKNPVRNRIPTFFKKGNKFFAKKTRMNQGTT